MYILWACIPVELELNSSHPSCLERTCHFTTHRHLVHIVQLYHLSGPYRFFSLGCCLNEENWLLCKGEIKIILTFFLNTCKVEIMV